MTPSSDIWLIEISVRLFGKVHGGSFTEVQVQIVLLTDAVTNAPVLVEWVRQRAAQVFSQTEVVAWKHMSTSPVLINSLVDASLATGTWHEPPAAQEATGAAKSPASA